MLREKQGSADIDKLSVYALNTSNQMQNSNIMFPCFLVLIYSFMQFILDGEMVKEARHTLFYEQPQFSSCYYWTLLRGSLLKSCENLVQFSARESFSA